MEKIWNTPVVNRETIRIIHFAEDLHADILNAKKHGSIVPEINK